MANDLTTTNDRAAGQRDLAWLAKNPSFWTIEAAREIAGPSPVEAIAAARRRIEAELAPVPSADGQREEWRKAMDERLRRLGVKIAPGMSLDQAGEWRGVMADALSDLPALIALTAARRAIHTPMRFLNEVEAAVRAEAAQLLEWRKVALNKLDDFQRLIRTAGQPALPDSVDRPLLPEEIRALSPAFRRMGLAQGWLTQEQFDAADAVEIDKAA